MDWEIRVEATHPSSEPLQRTPSRRGDQRTWKTLAVCPLNTFSGWSELVAT